MYPRREYGGALDRLPPGYVLLARTPNGRVANLNKGTQGEECYLCYRPDVATVLRRFFAAPFESHVQRQQVRCIAQWVIVAHASI